MIDEKEKVIFEEGIKILRSLGYSADEINCIKNKETLKEVMSEEGYCEGYNCWRMSEDVNSETEIIAQ